MSKDIQAQAIMLSLEPLMTEAIERNLWFYHESKDAGEVWASPEFLKYQNSKGLMIWSPEHWELRSPMAYMKKLHAEAEALVEEYNEMAAKLKIPDVLLMEKQTMVPESENAA